jgi:transposase
VPDLPGADTDYRMTKRCRWYIEDQCLKRHFTDIASTVGVDEKTVRKIAMEVIEDRHRGYRVRAPQILGIDELHLLGVFRAIFVDLSEGARALDLLETRSKEAVAMWISRLRDKSRVQVVAMDMWRPYLKVVEAVLPNTPIVIDKFHVQRLATDSLEQVRRARQLGMNKKQRVDSKKSRFLLLRRPFRLSKWQELRLDGWLKNDDALAGAYEAKEAFYRIWDITKRDEAEAAWTAWQASLTPMLRKAFRPLIRAVTNWHKPIFNYWSWRVTNAGTEARNGIIGLTNRIGRGYTFEVIRAKSIYASMRPNVELFRCPSCRGLFEERDMEMVGAVQVDPEKLLPIEMRFVCQPCVRFHTERGVTMDQLSTLKSE